MLQKEFYTFSVHLAGLGRPQVHVHGVMLGFKCCDVCVQVCGLRLVFQDQIQRVKRSWQFENLARCFECDSVWKY